MTKSDAWGRSLQGPFPISRRISPIPMTIERSIRMAFAGASDDL